MKILLISQDENLIKKAGSIFSENNLLNVHELSILKGEAGPDTDFSYADFLIIDLSTEIKNNSFLTDFLKNDSIKDFQKLLLIQPGQEDLLSDLYKYPVRINDFIFKENTESELALRIENILFRDFKIKPANSIVIRDLVLDLDKYELLINGKKIELTFKEYQLLKLLLENKNKVFTRSRLLSDIWEYDYYGGSRTVDVHMRRLRSKMELPYSDMLKTVRNVGYMFSPAEFIK
ncbi:MAG: response regulator transcription factor [Actinobacteria bacterium]|nr:response regulator transcription factor [Actinomycetota bacterium]